MVSAVLVTPSLWATALNLSLAIYFERSAAIRDVSSRVWCSSLEHLLGRVSFRVAATLARIRCQNSLVSLIVALLLLFLHYLALQGSEATSIHIAYNRVILRKDYETAIELLD
jgi:hypothetical protein